MSKSDKKEIALYFGTFNPIHVGHLVIANYIAQLNEVDEVWLVVSPQNPLKKKASMLPDYHRLAMVREAISENTLLKASDIEFNLPQPSYTIDTLTYITEKYPEHSFSLVNGEDNLKSFPKTFYLRVRLKFHMMVTLCSFQHKRSKTIFGKYGK